MMQVTSRMDPKSLELLRAIYDGQHDPGWPERRIALLSESGLCQPNPDAPGYRLTTKGMFVLSLQGE